MKKTYNYLAIIFLILAGAALLLRGDFMPFFRWYVLLLLMGIGFYPVAESLFRAFDDRGWVFSKSLSIILGGYIFWLFTTSGLQLFTSRRCVVVTLILFGIIWVYYLGKLAKEKSALPPLERIAAEELVFLVALLAWTLIFGFKPEAHGTEKFMDYGFMAAMDRSLNLPATDMWYGLEPINYYYGGQYYAVYLSKLAYLSIRYTYNLMRAAIGAFAFCMPMSIVRNMLRARLQGEEKRELFSCLGGFLAGIAVSLAGNMHYVLYGLLGSVLKLPGYESYWFPSSTRYIGHNPENADRCIHEFPSYSTVLGDLHAHYINIIVVLTIVALLYTWVRRVRYLELGLIEEKREHEERQRRRPSKFIAQKNWKIFFQRNGAESPLLVAAVLIGICKWTNYWDFIIYFTASAFVIVAVSLYRYQDQFHRSLASIGLHAAEVWAIMMLVPLPFMLSFEGMYSGIGISTHHSAPYQLVVLWGLPVLVCLLLLIKTIRQFREDYPKLGEEERSTGAFLGFFRYAPQSDRFALVLALCAMGLVLIPELVYVRDIYEQGYSRSNTMFKLTYQAYILFGIVMAYSLVRLLVLAKGRALRAAAWVCVFLFALTVGYLPNSVHSWFGNVFDFSRHQSIDATAFIYATHPADATAIDWLTDYVKGQPIVLEAYGDSYSDYCRVSAVTGLPTIEGWYVHEWLWRGDTEDLNAKREDIRQIYETTDVATARRLVDRYGISYIFVGSMEREAFNVQDPVIKQLGEVVFYEGTTYILQVES